MIQETALMVYSFVLNNYNSKFDHFINEKTHIAKFVEGKGMHEHFDASRPNDIATLIYLNNDYDGGDIYFPKYEMSFKPEPGDLLCFPDNPSFIHGVKPIIRGTRFTLPRWFTRIV
jgi:predicted 2-oxoglutarate/Fe(II)-dependent dioxygenase YbiX